MFCTLALNLFRKAHSLFLTVEEEIIYLEERNIDDALIHLLMLHKQKSKAAKVHLSRGRIIEAIDLFLDDSENRQDSIQSAIDCVLQGLRKAMPLGGSVAGLEVMELIKRSDLLDLYILDQNIRDEVRSTSLSCFHVFTSTVLDQYVQGHKLRMQGRLHPICQYLSKLGQQTCCSSLSGSSIRAHARLYQHGYFRDGLRFTAVLSLYRTAATLCLLRRPLHRM